MFFFKFIVYVTALSQLNYRKSNWHGVTDLEFERNRTNLRKKKKVVNT